MNTVRSVDGTEIAFDRLGDGPPVILVTGASCARDTHAELAALLASRFTVLNFDRRGRGDSGDTQPYAVEREIEDIAAVAATVDGPVRIFGNSSGAVLALRATATAHSGTATAHSGTATGPNICGLAMWEAPFTGDPAAQHNYVTSLTSLLAQDRRGDAMALFMTRVGLPPEMITGMRGSPMWPGMEAIAPTLAYDAAVMGDSTLPPAMAEAVKVPALIVTGSSSGAWADDVARDLTSRLPDCQHQVLDGQNHNVSWNVLAPVLDRFFATMD